MRLKKTILKLVTGLILTASTSMAHALAIEVAQESSAGAGDFDANIIGSIDPFTTTLTNSGFFSYGNPFNASFCDGVVDNCIGRPSLISNESHLFLVDASDGLGVFIVHDKPNDGSGGSATNTFSLVGDTATVLVSDDPNEFTGTGTNFTGNFNWIGCCTDGGVIGSLDGDWTMFLEFDSFTGLTGWTAVSANSQDSVGLQLVNDRRVRLRSVSQQIPEPNTLALIGIGLAGFGFTRIRKQN